MPPRAQNNPTPDTAPDTQSGTQTTISTQRRPGRAKGSQGYSIADCQALVAAVKQYLPLGSQEWAHVLEKYNTYANTNNRLNRDLDPLKLKFRALVNHSKPTGDPDCPSYVREAKATAKAMEARAHVVACNDDGDECVNDQ